MLLSENPEGYIEYKWKLINVSNEELEKKQSQMMYRLEEGNGECMYYLGIKDNGKIIGLTNEEYIETIKNLIKIINTIKCYYKIIEINECENEKKWYKILIQRINYGNYIDVKIGIIGNVDSGKSTLTGVITKGCQDNGRGLARSLIFNHRHELDTGRTSSIGHHIVGFDKEGNIVNKQMNGKIMKWQEIVDKSKKIVTFYDLAGHEKYLKTTIYGLSTFDLDVCLVIINGNSGINHMTREHINVSLSLNIPIIIIITKIDITPEEKKKEIYKKLEIMCNRRINKIPIKIDNIKKLNDYYKKDNILSIIEVSNVTLENIKLLENYLSMLYTKIKNNEINEEFNLQIDCNYHITGFGTVVSGLVKSGKIKINDNVYLGPNEFGEFIPTKIKSIHIKLRKENELMAGIYGCVALRNIERNMIKKGMVLIDEKAPKKVVKRFWANIQIFKTHSTTIKPNYQPFLHIENIRQSAKLLSIEKEDGTNIIRNGDKAKVYLEFLYKSEYIHKNMKVLFRDGLMKASGIIIDIE
jgi:elongation factor 1-alpha